MSEKVVPERKLPGTVKLNRANLDAVPDHISRPNYRLDELTPGILHIGVGNFHRAHQAWYLHKLFQTGQDHDWAIIGAGVKAFDGQMREKLAQQDWLTTIVELDPNGFSASITGAMIDFIKTESIDIIRALVDPAIRIVSLTVTEGGYFIDASTGGFNPNHPEIVADIENPDFPQTVFGIIIKALVERNKKNVPPFTIMSCDNLPENGHVTRDTVLGLAKYLAPGHCDWIASNVAFPNSMVDCITPATTEHEIKLVGDKFGVEDAAPVVCEPFHQWVLEDNFPTGRPGFEKVGVQFVDDVAPYELMKLRILNGGHAAIAYPAGLLDIHYVHDAMNDPEVSGFLEKLEQEEIIPTVPEIAGVSKAEYFETITERFSNEAVGDTIPRLCFDGSSRQPKFILPAIEDRLASGKSVAGLALESALWCRYCFGETESGQIIEDNDPIWDRLKARSILAKTEPKAWLELQDIYGALSDNSDFSQAFENALKSIWQIGTRKTLCNYINS